MLTEHALHTIGRIVLFKSGIKYLRDADVVKQYLSDMIDVAIWDTMAAESDVPQEDVYKVRMACFYRFASYEPDTQDMVDHMRQELQRAWDNCDQSDPLFLKLAISAEANIDSRTNQRRYIGNKYYFAEEN